MLFLFTAGLTGVLLGVPIWAQERSWLAAVWVGLNAAFIAIAVNGWMTTS